MRACALLLVVPLAACGSSGAGGPHDGAMPGDGAASGDGSIDPDGAATDALHNPDTPGAGAHGLSYFEVTSHAEVLDTPAMSTQATGSTIVVSVGRGNASAFARPTDNKGNGPYPRLGTMHPYTNWPTSGTELYAISGVTGGAGHVVSTTTPYDDELTLAAVEVYDAVAVVDFQWREVLAPNPVRSASVTTTGPATLVAFWWGDAGAEGDKTAVPDSGFVVVDSILSEGSLVQCAVAVKEVAAAGTYDVGWTATPVQGAQLWLVAVQ